MNLPTTEQAKRIALLYNRRLTTPWADKEIKAYRAIAKSYQNNEAFLEDLTLLEKYYETERRKGEAGIHRRDLCTLLNNFSGELDRAKAMKSKPKMKHNYFNPLTNKETINDEEFQKAGEKARELVQQLRKRLNPSP